MDTERTTDKSTTPNTDRYVRVRPIHMWVAECLSCGWEQTHRSEENARWEGDEHAHGHTETAVTLVVLGATGPSHSDAVHPSSDGVMGAYTADWFDGPATPHGGTYGVRGPAGLVRATSPFKAGWEKAQALAAEMNAAHISQDAQGS